MPKRSSRQAANEIAKSIVNQVADNVAPVAQPVKSEKNPAAVALVQLGGKKGGLAQGSVLSKGSSSVMGAARA